jgi:chemotaxis protein MotB
MSGHGGGGGGGNPALEEDPPEHENHERYLLTYADMITLLLALFIVLFAIGQTDQEKFNEFRAGLASEFGNEAYVEAGQGLLSGGDALTTPVTPSEGASADIQALVEEASAVQEVSSSDAPETTTTTATTIGGGAPGDAGTGETTTTTVVTGSPGPGGQATGDGDNFDGYGGHLDSTEAGALAQQIQGVIEGDGFKTPTDFVVTNDVNRGVVISLKSDTVNFATGSSELSEAGRRALDALAPAIQSLDNDIAIDGFTDDVGDEGSNFRLSGDRAMSALDYLRRNHDVASARMSSSAHGENKPVAGNDTEDGKRANRRIEIVIRIDQNELFGGPETPSTVIDPTAGAATASTTTSSTQGVVMAVPTTIRGATGSTIATTGRTVVDPVAPAAGAATTPSTTARPTTATTTATPTTTRASSGSGSRTGVTAGTRGCVIDCETAG